MVSPDPAILRIREDVYRRVVLPGTEPVLEEPGRVHLALDPALRGDGFPVPLRAILLLGPPAVRVALERLDVGRCLPNLWALSFRLPGDTGAARCFQKIASLAAHVPAWILRRPFRFDSLDRVVETITTTCPAT